MITPGCEFFKMRYFVRKFCKVYTYRRKRDLMVNKY